MASKKVKPLLGVALVLGFLLGSIYLWVTWSAATDECNGNLPPSRTWVKLKQYTCAVGTHPWETLQPYEQFRAFYQIFAQRPGDAINDGGASFFHYFALWCTIKALKPEVVIESGIHHGIGSWLLRQAAGPQVQMIFISPEDPKIYRDREKTTIYFTNREFVDFSKIPWFEVLPDKSKRKNSIIFFDDHQAAVRRIQEARSFGFRHMLFDDNYLPGYGDTFSLKMVCKASIYDLLNVKMSYIDNFGKIRKPLSIEEFYDEQKKFDFTVDTYAEFPPLWSGPTRFAIDQGTMEKLTLVPLFNRSEVSHLSINLDAESKRYTHIVYVKLTDA